MVLAGPLRGYGALRKMLGSLCDFFASADGAVGALIADTMIPETIDEGD